MENLISLIIDLLTALFSGSKDKKETSSPPRPDPSRPRPQPGPTSWENELRRLLDNQAPPAQAPPRPLPVAAPQRPRVITVQAPPRPVLIETPPPIFTPRPRPVLISPPPLPAGVQPSNQPLASLSQSKAAYDRASQLDVAAAARIERVPGQEVGLTTVTRKADSLESMEVASLFKNPQATRLAVIAAVILGPPRAFEEQTSANF